MTNPHSRSRHLIDPEIIQAIDLIPTTDLDLASLMESRSKQLQMLPQTVLMYSRSSFLPVWKPL